MADWYIRPTGGDFTSFAAAWQSASVVNGDRLIGQSGYNCGPVFRPTKRLTYMSEAVHDGTIDANGAAQILSHSSGSAFEFTDNNSAGSVIDGIYSKFSLSGAGRFVTTSQGVHVRNCVFDVSDINFQSTSQIASMFYARFRFGHTFWNNIQYGNRGGANGIQALVHCGESGFFSFDLLANNSWLDADGRSAGNYFVYFISGAASIDRCHNNLAMGDNMTFLGGAGTLTVASHNTTSAGSVSGTDGVSGADPANYVINPTSNHTPLSSSPANGTGLNLSGDFTTDAIGVTRSIWDRGAIAYIAAGGVPPLINGGLINNPLTRSRLVN